MNGIEVLPDDGLMIADPTGLLLVKRNTENPSKTLHARITSSFNTGWVGKRCLGILLCSTDTTSLIGSGELIQNGTGDSTVGWLASTPDVSVASVGGQLEVTNNGAGWIYQSFPTVIGQRYYVTNEFITKVGGGRIYIGTSIGNLAYHNNTSLPTTNIPITFVATTTEAFISLGDSGGGVGVVNVYDNLSAQLADVDRSVNNKGPVVYGTITRPPVATGAELVGYSGFSGSNYMILDGPFGAGDMAMTFWAKDLSTGGVANLINLSTSDLIATHGGLYVQGGFLYHQFAGGISTGVSVSGAGPFFITASRKNGVFRISVNKKDVGVAVTNVTDFTNHVMLIGINRIYSNPLDVGLITQVKHYDRSLSQDEIDFFYHQERPMFQPGAQVTLNGTSDDVTALTEDEITGLRHPCTSQGRNDFSGLIRVGNTTTGRTVIAAHDGLILEQ